MAGQSFTCDTRDLIPLLKGLGQVEKSLRDEANVRLRNAAGKAAEQLVAALKQSASSSATPQAAIVSESIRVKRDRLVSVSIGGTKQVGQRGTSAGAILWGSEHGGVNFQAARGGSYWIQPAVKRYAAGGAQTEYLTAVNEILHDAGVI
ncbi:MAG TPA: hypothetical protein VFE12_08430 [Acetobacteraceae bacterium]|jgi:hypothetical protein|nr:hypothetical protein [Acetobacteraceae bacterium]